MMVSDKQRENVRCHHLLPQQSPKTLSTRVRPNQGSCRINLYPRQNGPEDSSRHSVLKLMVVTLWMPSGPVIKVSLGCYRSYGVYNNLVVLRILPDDSEALSTKLFLLLQTDQYEAALVVIDRNKDKSKLAFERAYALYRSREDDEAQRVIQSLEQQNADDWGLAHLKAQLVRVHPPWRAAIGNEFMHNSRSFTVMVCIQRHIIFTTNFWTVQAQWVLSVKLLAQCWVVPGYRGTFWYIDQPSSNTEAPWLHKQWLSACHWFLARFHLWHDRERIATDPSHEHPLFIGSTTLQDLSRETEESAEVTYPPRGCPWNYSTSWSRTMVEKEWTL